jgi:hypothetical protein
MQHIKDTGGHRGYLGRQHGQYRRFLVGTKARCRGGPRHIGRRNQMDLGLCPTISLLENTSGSP